MEGMIFLEAGAWKSIEELEDILILEELIYLYEQAVKKERRLMRTVASAMGADIGDDDDEEYRPTGRTFDSETGGYVPDSINSGKDVSMLPISIGYES
jgi:hypothetical protein